MKTKISFEEYLEEQWSENESDGVLDDDMSDSFDMWAEQLDVQEVMNYAQEYGTAMFNLAEKSQIHLSMSRR